MSGASLVAGLSQLDTLLRLAPAAVVLSFLTITTIALATAVFCAYLKHAYKMWDMKSQATSDGKAQAQYMRLANRDLSFMRGAMTGCLTAIVGGYLVLSVALWYRYATDPKALKPSAATIPQTTTLPASTQTTAAPPKQPAASTKP